jgi:putative endonuclease
VGILKPFASIAHPPTGGGRATPMFSVYALYNKERKRIYIGQTADLENRLQLHHKKIFRRSFTAKLEGEWVLIYSEEAASRLDALKRERQLKSFRGREFLKSRVLPP